MLTRLDEILQRDGDGCVWCGNSPWRSDMTIEHLLPRSHTGYTASSTES